MKTFSPLSPRGRWRGWLGALRGRADRLYGRHGRALWILHSIWAFITGVAVLILARERYGFVPWVVAFLGLTWGSTLFFSRLAPRLANSWTGRVGSGFVSYLTRVMYQETLFFLLPFYTYSVGIPSWGLLFLALLAGLAVLSCADLVFDGWIRRSRAFGLLFFGFVTFAAVNFLLPAVLGLRLEIATPAAALLAVGAALPLAYRLPELRRRRIEVGGVALAAVALVAVGRPAIPPVPLRLSKLIFAEGIADLRPVGRLAGRVAASELQGGRLVVIAEIFAPIRLPTEVVLRWYHEGRLVRRSREVAILAHGAGFRVWDVYAPPVAPGKPRGAGLPPGTYTVRVTTAEGQTFGRARLEVLAAP